MAPSHGVIHIEWLFHHADRRACRDARLVYTLHDQRRRAESARVTKLAVKAQPDSVNTVEKLLNTSESISCVDVLKSDSTPASSSCFDVLTAINTTSLIVNPALPAAESLFNWHRDHGLGARSHRRCAAAAVTAHSALATGAISGSELMY